MSHRFGCRSAVVLLCVLLGGACTDAPPYNFNDPYIVHELPLDLKELSGLVILQGKYVVGVSDETGSFYVIDFTSGEVVRTQQFGPPGDYEDIIRIGSSLYVLESNGTIYEIRDVRDSRPAPEVYRTGLPHETEGLAYDRANHRLLISSAVGDSSAGTLTGAVYGFDLRDHTLNPSPLFRTPIVPLRAQLAGDTSAVGLDEEVFRPSALAVQPGTGDIYLTSSRTPILAAYDRAGELKTVYALPARLFLEPEGITFLSTGDIIIANEESSGRPATILRFRHSRPF